jgi:hypothetical protein
MVKKETHQENWDPGKLWTGNGVFPCWSKDDPSCESDTGGNNMDFRDKSKTIMHQELRQDGHPGSDVG